MTAERDEASAGSHLALALRTLQEHAHRTTRFASEAAELLDLLPERLRHWEMGRADEAHRIPIEHWHGADALHRSWDAARARADGGSPQEICAVLPRPAPPGSTPADRAPGRSHGGGIRARVILPREAGDWRPTGLSPGTHLKLLPDPPLCFWVDSRSTVALPATPTAEGSEGALIIHGPAVAGLAREIFEALWASAHSPPAEPVPPGAAQTDTAAAWSELLSLMRSGDTVDAASRKLGVHPRTGRRRVAAAMRFYGADTLFALGRAWGADRLRAAAGSGEDDGGSHGG